MKNQNDLIVSGVAVFLLVVVAAVAYFERPTPNAIPAPDKVNTSDPQLPSNTQPVMSNSLPVASSQNGASGGQGPTARGTTGGGGGGGVGGLGGGTGGAPTALGPPNYTGKNPGGDKPQIAGASGAG